MNLHLGFVLLFSQSEQLAERSKQGFLLPDEAIGDDKHQSEN
ncbi:MAG TPA: hypothetical protein VN934_06060 [Candidatus Tumulicola sp.]|nr:hypothetical protein [Candidatus Tumulicola sp.]